MDYFSQSFLTQHIKTILAFYSTNIMDSNGGFNQNYYNDGSVFATGDKHLVSSTRMVINNAIAWQLFKSENFKKQALKGLEFVEQEHQLPDDQGYVWTIESYQHKDKTQQAYGYAFVLLMYSRCFEFKVIDSSEQIYRLYQLLEQRFWQHEYNLYADECNEEGQLTSYRGQNANMHICEAMIAAYTATKDEIFLQRAQLIAKRICFELTEQTQGLIWEHYDERFEIDWDYNKDDPKNLYRPWGFQPGHQTEWTKLLMQIHHYQPNQAWIEKASFLFDKAMDLAWDKSNGGLVYGFDQSGNWCDSDKYFWVQAESFAAAALLYQNTKNEKYLTAYEQIWHYSWQHMIDHQYGAWFRLLDNKNQAYNEVKSQAGTKCDYHTIGACFDVLKAIYLA